MQNSLSGYAEALSFADPKDDAAFHKLLEQGVEVLHLVDKDIAREFGVSRPTVTRWRNGVNAPHPAMRKPVYTWLEQRVKLMLKRNAEPIHQTAVVARSPKRG